MPWQDLAGVGGKRRPRLRGRGVQKFKFVYLQVSMSWFTTPMHLTGAADLNAARIPPARFEEVEGSKGLVRLTEPWD